MKKFRCSVFVFAFCMICGAGFAQNLTIYTEESFTLQKVDAHGSLVGGIGVEVVWEIQKRIGDTTPIQVVSWARGYSEALEKPNILLFSTARSHGRENLFFWLGKITSIKHILVGKKSKFPHPLTEEEAKKLSSIGVVQMDTREELLRAKGFTNLEFGVSTEHNIKKAQYDRIEVFASSDTALEVSLIEAGLHPEEYGEIYTIAETSLYLAFSLGTDPKILGKWSKGYQEIVKDGTLNVLQKKYYPHLYN